jgi:type IV secretory pathway TrbF-like protein
MPKSKYKKRADGRHLAQIPTSEYQENGRPKLKNIYARTQLELDSKIADFRKQVETGIIIEDKGITVAQYAEAFMTYKASREDSTRYMYSSASPTSEK